MKNTTSSQNGLKIGYLNSEIEFFSLKDSTLNDIDFHYHEFNKVLILLHGKLDYHIEGQTYELKENDIIFVPAGKLHKPVLKPCDYYERLIIYVSDEFLLNNSSADFLLNRVFEIAEISQSYMLRPVLYSGLLLGHIIAELNEEIVAGKPGASLMKNILFLNLMTKLNRAVISDGIRANSVQARADKILDIIEYINSHLSDDLSVDSIASRFYMSRYYLMHSFKEATGYTLGNFIATKRIIFAKELISSGASMTEACFACGYNSYSSFYRAYKKEIKNLEENLQIL